MLVLVAEEPTLETIESYAPSRAKDFYLWHFLENEPLSSEQSDWLFSQVNSVTSKVLFSYVNRSDNSDLKEAVRCMQLPANKLSQQKDACLSMGLTVYKATKLPMKTLKKVTERLKSIENFSWLNSMVNTYNANALEKDPKAFLELFNNCGKSYRIRLNHAFHQEFFQKLSRLEGFDRFVESIALDTNLKQLQKSLLYFEPKKNVSTHAYFYLALNAIEHNHHKTALKRLKVVQKHDYFQMNRDKALFWNYLITKEPSILEKLYLSSDLNIYTIFAAETLKKEPISFYSLPETNSTNPLIHEFDPFEWARFISAHNDTNLSKSCETLNTINTQVNSSSYAFYLEKCTNYTLHPFALPYFEQLSSLSTSEKAFFYAIGRQESRLIAGGLSSVFAQGLMQIMPFLSKAIAKQNNEILHANSMFNPQKNITYANIHLKFLTKRIKHPLFVAYAYNGGIGFLKNLLKKSFLKSNSKFEPYLSMEKVPYAETREYGKKVLANYIIYSKILEEPIALLPLVQKLKQ